MKRVVLFILILLSCNILIAQNMEKKILVAYFSATGRTHAKALSIAQATGADLYQIVPLFAYTDADLDWRDTESRSTYEMNDPSARPAIGGEGIEANQYDIIFLGYPIWWDLAPRIINTWIESQNLVGKTVIPFATSGSSTIANSARVLKQTYPYINWQSGKLLNCSNAQVAEWAKSINK